MAKKKTELKNLGKQHVKEALLRVHPFLSEKFRPLDRKELTSIEVYKEFFPKDLNVQFFKLRAVYVFQN